MTIASIRNHQATSTGQNVADIVSSFVTAFVEVVTKFRADRLASKTQPFYHNDKAHRLERAQRDVNRLWQHHF